MQCRLMEQLQGIVRGNKGSGGGGFLLMFGIEKCREECRSLPLVQVRAPFVLDRLVLSRLKDPRYTSNSRGVG